MEQSYETLERRLESLERRMETRFAYMERLLDARQEQAVHKIESLNQRVTETMVSGTRWAAALIVAFSWLTLMLAILFRR